MPKNNIPQKLQELLDRTRDHVMTPSEIHAQRVSLIMGLRGTNSTLTRGEVDKFLAERGC